MTAVVDLVMVASQLAEMAEAFGCEVVGVQVLTYTEEPLQLHVRGNEAAVDTLAEPLTLGDPVPGPYANYDRAGQFQGHPVRVYSGRTAVKS